MFPYKPIWFVRIAVKKKRHKKHLSLDIASSLGFCQKLLLSLQFLLGNIKMSYNAICEQLL
jgi:hypothetical protein